MSERAPRRKETPAPAPVSGPQPESVGGTLRHRRQMRGQSLEAVYQATRIPRAMLQALEEDRFADFPAPIYMRGFLKTYCEYLELDLEPLWQKAAPAPRQKEDSKEAAPEPEQPCDQEPPQWLSARLVLALAVLVVVLLVWGTIKLFAARKPAAPSDNPPPAAAAAAPAPEAAAPVVPAPAEFTGPAAPVEAPAAPAVDRSQLVVTALADGWVSLRRNGQLVFEGRLPAGKHLDYRGVAFELHTSDPAGLKVELGGEPLVLTTLKPAPDGSYRFAPR